MVKALSHEARADILQTSLESAHATLNLISSIGFGNLLNTKENREHIKAELDQASEALRIAGIDRQPGPRAELV
jgi:hypothetical protein